MKAVNMKKCQANEEIYVMGPLPKLQDTLSSLINIVVLVNNWDVCRSCIGASSLYVERKELFRFYEDNPSASVTFNRALRDTGSDYIVFVHQDVYLPAGWELAVLGHIKKLNERDPAWAVLGIVGIDETGDIRGSSWSTGLNREIGTALSAPVPAQSVDELVIIFNRKSGLSFDDNLPGFHMYGTDIVLNGRRNGNVSYVIHAPVVHNSLPYVKFDRDFATVYHYMRKKWAYYLPVRTPSITLTRSGWPMHKILMRQFFMRDRREQHSRLLDPAAKARELGYE